MVFLEGRHGGEERLRCNGADHMLRTRLSFMGASVGLSPF